MSGLPLIFSSAPSAHPAVAEAFGGGLFALGSAPALFAVITAAGCAALAAGWALERSRRLASERLSQEARVEFERLRAIVDESADGFVVTEGGEGRLILANRAAADLLGYPQGTVLGMTHTDFYPEELRLEMSERLRRRLERGGAGVAELLLRHGSGEAIPVEVRATTVTAGGRRYVQAVLRDLRRLRAAQRELRESEARYAAFFESVPVAVLEKDYGLVTDWLQRLRERGVTDIMGYLRPRPIELVTLYGNVQVLSANRAALKGMDLLEVARSGCPLSPDEIPSHLLYLFQQELEALWEGRTHLSCTLDHVKPDGRLGHALLHWSSSKPAGPGGRQTALLVFTDLTDLRAAEERLHKSEERPRLALQGFNVGIWECDFAAGKAYYSDDWRRMLGYRPEEIGERPGEWLDRVHPEDKPRVEDALEAHLAGRSPRYESEHRIQCGDGTYKWVLSRGQAVRDGDAKPVRIVGANEDISGKKAAEEALRAGEARYRQLFENSPVAIIEADVSSLVLWHEQARGAGADSLDSYAAARPRELADAESGLRITEMNTAALRLVRAGGRERALGAFAAGWSEETRGLWRGILKAIWSGRHEAEGEACLRTLDGVVVRVMYRWWVPSEGAAPMRSQLVLADLSAIAKAESDLVAEQLRSSKLESLGILAGGIAHDFNNLLTVVMGNLTLAMMDPPSMSAAGRWLRESEKGVLKARDLTQQLLTIAKGGDPVRTAVALPDVVRETTEFTLHGSRVKARFAFDPELLPADVDKAQIGQVVQNLVINAVQAMPQGGTIILSLCNSPAPVSMVGVLAGAPFVRLSLEDTGMGISAEHLSKIFDPYFTTKAQGSGLGLATVYSIVRKHGGHIEVESTEGRGTCFRIWLPAAKLTLRAERPEPSRPAARSGRILFMDDEEPLRRLGQALLQSLGYDVKVVADGSLVVAEYEAARRIGRPFDLVMMDLTVPGGLGAQGALEQLRLKDPGARAVVMSGYASDPVCTDFRSHGFCGVIAKPYRVSDLGRTIQSVMSGT